MRSPGWRIGAAGVIAVLTLVGGVPAQAAPTLPVPGECYDLDDEVLQEGGWWPETVPVPCTQTHTFEVTDVGLLPADANAFDFAKRQCTALNTWTSLGINLPVAGIVPNPLRVEPWSFAVRSAPASYVCGGVAVRYLGADDPVAVPLRSSIRELPPRQRVALRHCADAANERGALEPPITVRCARRPSWLVTSWITWKAFYDDYPGRPALKDRARDLCGPDRTFSLPTRADWEDGVPTTWCYRLRA